ncbi:hypothetical protein [Nannocystis sp. SCPEA4]|uniref:hypothetical protein n=1 Tax=Nannocystis sp. SCPEA4 TaxID=2996787 RepID=UPI00226FC604|nr:hypothetical protein [Nannocystis sp. SCPEA4]MCY1054753.1 hypothetical protein [Nannocystis sp. SCPEA4]
MFNVANATTLRRGRRAPSVALLCTATALISCTADEPFTQDQDSGDIAVRNGDFTKQSLDATSVSIQLLDKPTAFADTRIFVTLSKDDAGKLANPQVVGAGDEDAPIVLRDDGKGGDVEAGDLVFTGLAFADVEALKARAEAEAKQDVAEVPQFVGRSVEKFVPATGIDLEKFLGGGVIKLPGAPKLLFSLASARHSLMITDPSVVRDFKRTYDPCTGDGDAMGPWGFGHLFTELANQSATGIDPADLVEDWLASWLTPQLPGSASVPVAARPMMQQLIDDWRNVSGGGALDLKQAPFRLLAIVNRIDLARRGKGGGGYGGGIGGDFLDAGEGRFVFGLVLPDGYKIEGYNKPGVLDEKTNCMLTPFTVIFEYKIDRPGCEKVRDWAQQWRALDTLPFGSTYNAALQDITDQFTAAGVSPDRGNGSALGQLRTNDFLMTFPWQMREHQLPVPSGFLTPHQVADTVDLFHDGTNSLGTWIATNIMGLPPQSFPWSGASDVPSPGTFWDGAHATLDTLLITSGPGNDGNDSRHNFSLGACSGCHARETDAEFTHVDNRTPLGRTQEAILSEFLLGEKINPSFDNTVTGNLHFVFDPSILPRGGTINPTNPQHRRSFRDLEFRQQKLVDFSSQSCLKLPPIDAEILEKSLLEKAPLPDDLFKGVQPVDKKQLPSLSLERLGDVPVAQVH